MSETRISRSKAWFIVAAVAVTAAGMLMSAQAQSPGAAGSAAPAFKPAQPLEQMMEGQNKLFKEVRAGILEQTWKEATLSAWILAEMANANQYQHDDAEYRKMASKMSEQCVELAKLLKNKDEEGARRQVSAIGQTCQACHDKYKK